MPSTPMLSRKKCVAMLKRQTARISTIQMGSEREEPGLAILNVFHALVEQDDDMLILDAIIHFLAVSASLH